MQKVSPGSGTGPFEKMYLWLDLLGKKKCVRDKFNLSFHLLEIRCTGDILIKLIERLHFFPESKPGADEKNYKRLELLENWYKGGVMLLY